MPKKPRIDILRESDNARIISCIFGQKNISIKQKIFLSPVLPAFSLSLSFSLNLVGYGQNNFKSSFTAKTCKLLPARAYCFFNDMFIGNSKSDGNPNKLTISFGEK